MMIQSAPMILIVLSLAYFRYFACASMATPNIPQEEMNALYEFYNSTNGKDWDWTGNGAEWVFSSNANPCEDLWEGITCLLLAPYTTNYIWQIRLAQFNLRGTLPDSIGYFSHLAILMLNQNSLNGTIPRSIENLTNLNSLVLQQNLLTGGIPDVFGNIEFMNSLSLSYNRLNGTLPASLFSMHRLGYLGLSQNYLNGTLPDDLGTALPELTGLELCCNAFSGTIPASIGNVTAATYLQLNHNEFTGTLPPEFGRMIALTSMHLHENNLRGSIPATYGNLTHLQSLYLSNNNLTGSLPDTLGNLTQVQDFQADNNRLNGSIPASLGRLKQLTQLVLANNNFTGSLPAALCALDQLSDLDVGYNKLNGGLPRDLGNLTSLVYLTIQGNAFTGTLPTSIGRLSQLERLQAGTNRLQGPLPDSLADLVNLNEFSMYENEIGGGFPEVLCHMPSLTSISLATAELRGPLPECISDLPLLFTLAIQQNGWSGTLPSSWGDLSGLAVLSLQFCYNVSGAIPASYANLDALMYLGLAMNKLNGTIPAFLGDLPNLRLLALGFNAFTGTLPSELGSATSLLAVDFGVNKLHGTIPASYGQLESIEYLSLGNNVLNGTIPVSFGGLLNLRTLNLGNCSLTGPLPASLGGLPQLQYLGLHLNQLTGSIPTGFFDVTYALSYLSLYNNKLTGTLPTSLARLHNLVYIGLQNNRFGGTIESIFDPAVHLRLDTVLMTSNQLTGTLPPQAFQLPSLKTFVAINNCFDGTLPATLCDAVQLESLELDALHSAAACQRKLFHGRGAYITEDSVAGAIPSCVFALPRLNTLHLSSNALTGSLPADLVVSPALSDLSLSYNKLTGSIPDAIQLRPWCNLDLSYNRLSGTLSRNFASQPTGALAVDLQFNKLSGVIPASVAAAAHINVLQSNIFSCRADHSDLPSNDPFLDVYQCGSDTTDTPYYAWLACASLAAVAIGAVYVGMVCGSANPWVTEKLTLAKKWLAASDPAARSHLSYISAVFSALGSTAAWLGLYCVLVLAPVYVILTVYYGTHTYEYIWSVSAVLKAGTVPLALQFVLYYALLCLFVCVYLRRIAALDPAHTVEPETSTPESAPSTTKVLPAQWSQLEPYLLCGAYVLINVVVVGVVNIYYVFLKLNSNPSFQLTISAFKVVWNGYCSPALSRYFLRPRPQHSTLELFVSLTNAIAIPVLAVIFVSPDCFYHAFVQESSLSATTTTSKICIAEGPQGCGVDTADVVDTVEYHPPYLYNFQCSYSFAEYYVPAFIYVCIFSVFVTPLVEAVLAMLHSRAVRGTRWFALIDTVTPRIYKLPNESAAPGQLSNPLRPYFDATQFTITQLTYLCLMLTLGAVFPPLAASIAVTIVGTVIQTRLKVGRFLTSVSEAGHNGYAAVVEQECTGVAGQAMLLRAMWMIFCFAAVFYGPFMFDTIGISDGFHSAYWVLFAFPAATIGIYGAYRTVLYVNPGLVLASAQQAAAAAAAAEEEESSKARLQSGSTTTVRTFSAMDVPIAAQQGREKEGETFNVLVAQL